MSRSLARARARGLSLIELMVTIAMGTLIVLAVSRYAVDSLHTQSTVSKLMETQDSAQATIEMIRGEIQRAGYRGCNQHLSTVGNITTANAEKINLLTKGIVVESPNTLKIATLIPLPQKVIVSDDGLTISAATPFPESDGSQPLVLGNCMAMQMFNMPLQGNETVINLPPDATISELLRNIDPFGNAISTPVALRLYQYRESIFTHDTGNNSAAHSGQLLLNGVPFVFDLESFTVTPLANEVYEVNLDFRDALREDSSVQTAMGGSHPDEGKFSFRIMAKNSGLLE